MSAAAPRREWRWFGWLRPRTLAGRTALVLVVGLMAVQGLGLTIHAFDRIELQRAAEARYISNRIIGLWRVLVNAPPERRIALLAEAEFPAEVTATLDPGPRARPDMPPVAPGHARLFRLEGPPPIVSRRLRPADIVSGMAGPSHIMISLRFPDPPWAQPAWLNLSLRVPAPRPWHSDRFLFAFAAMSVAALLLILWAVRRLTRPVADLAAAAERLGRDVNAPALPENGPREVAQAAAAFNGMASNIRRFVADRTQMLAAISHDLRTPITRLRLRAEFMDDEDQQRRMLADLAEMEAMIASTLAFARDDAAAEPATPLDLASLVRTVLDEASDANPDLAERIHYGGPEHFVMPLRPLAMKRALVNLVANALKYGDAARLTLEPRGGGARLVLEDDGPGIPDHSHEKVFQPFQRIEGSRNRETGGTGLGLTIARSIFRAHGGEVTLHNRAASGEDAGGLRVVMVLPG
ncbi:ATP-binding protein [Roseococcus thiosulfatophilus]|uniref:ATP-binding protein n=1 Tax=Roseococcus thiosulfatophilus TaxID=35813 RepID=UPI001F5D35C6|nr:ATP-binding protein [Roseococcus thiosulfatophilus]